MVPLMDHVVSNAYIHVHPAPCIYIYGTSVGPCLINCNHLWKYLVLLRATRYEQLLPYLCTQSGNLLPCFSIVYNFR